MRLLAAAALRLLLVTLAAQEGVVPAAAQDAAVKGVVPATEEILANMRAKKAAVLAAEVGQLRARSPAWCSVAVGLEITSRIDDCLTNRLIAFLFLFLLPCLPPIFLLQLQSFTL
ncbi:hypothetical protein EJB05_06097, partial [Eragrostis curvula]